MPTRLTLFTSVNRLAAGTWPTLKKGCAAPSRNILPVRSGKSLCRSVMVCANGLEMQGRRAVHNHRPCLWIHVGPHKTGTTSIQRLIKDEQASLIAQGVTPWSDLESTNAFHFAHAFIRTDLHTPMRLLEKIEPGTHALAAFESWADPVQGRGALVSSEAFCFLRTAEEQLALLGLLMRPFSAIRPIRVRRIEREWRRSWFGQLSRMGLAERIEALPDAHRVTGDWYFDFDALLQFWAGIGPTTVIDYDREVAEHGSIIPAFLRSLGLGDSICATDYFLNMSERRP